MHHNRVMNKKSRIQQWLRIPALLLATVLLCSGCSTFEALTRYYARDKIHCQLAYPDIQHFSCGDIAYAITAERAEDEQVGDWIGYIRQLVVVDKTGKVVAYQDATIMYDPDVVVDGEQKQPGNHTIQFFNVYREHGESTALLVDIGNQRYRAVDERQLDPGSELYTPQPLAQDASSDSHEASLRLDPENAYVFYAYGQRYTVTNEKLGDRQLGELIGGIDDVVVFDVESARPLSKKQLAEIDWLGTQSDKERDVWNYGEVSHIQGSDPDQELAVEINGSYRLARRIE